MSDYSGREDEMAALRRRTIGDIVTESERAELWREKANALAADLEALRRAVRDALDVLAAVVSDGQETGSSPESLRPDPVPPCAPAERLAVGEFVYRTGIEGRPAPQGRVVVDDGGPKVVLALPRGMVVWATRETVARDRRGRSSV